MLIMNQPPTVGDIIHEMYLKPSRLSLSQAAVLCELEQQQLQDIINGDLKIGYELAYQLAKGFNTSHNFWLNCQRDSDRAREENNE